MIFFKGMVSLFMLVIVHVTVRRHHENTPVTGSGDPEEIHVKYLIGGAGWAGIFLGKELTKFGLDDFLVIEASDRVGGRTKAIEIGGYKVASGSTWISGLRQGRKNKISPSPVWALKEQVDLECFETDFEELQIFQEDGTRFRDEENFFKGMYRTMDRAFSLTEKFSLECTQVPVGEKAKSFCKRLEQNEDGKFVASDDDFPYDFALKKAGFDRETTLDATKNINPLLARAFEIWYYEGVRGRNIEVSSLNNSFPEFPYIDYEYLDCFITDQRAYDHLIKTAASEYLASIENDDDTLNIVDTEKLHLNTKVLKVEWDPNGNPKDRETKVRVHVCTTVMTPQENGPDLYPCDGSAQRVIVADYFIPTFSIAVYKKSLEKENDGTSIESSNDVAPRFDPPLQSQPQLKEAFENADLGIEVKMVLKFTSKFWNNNLYWLNLYPAKEDGDTSGEFEFSENEPSIAEWYNLDTPRLNNRGQNQLLDSHLVAGAVYGKRAEYFSTLSDAAIKTKAFNSFKHMFGDRFEKKNNHPLEETDIEEIFISRWKDDPLFYGAYNHVGKLGFTEAMEQNLRKPYGNLYFSGAMMCERHGGWTHGAALAAISTVKLLRGLDPYPDFCDDDPAVFNGEDPFF